MATDAHDRDLEPDSIDAYPAASPIADTYKDNEVVYEAEGGEVLVASKEQDYVVIIDEGTMADLLDPVADAALIGSLVKVLHFGTAEARDAYVRRRWPHRRDLLRHR